MFESKHCLWSCGLMEIWKQIITLLIPIYSWAMYTWEWYYGRWYMNNRRLQMLLLKKHWHLWIHKFMAIIWETMLSLKLDWHKWSTTPCQCTKMGSKLILKELRHAPDIQLHLIFTRKLDDDHYYKIFSRDNGSSLSALWF